MPLLNHLTPTQYEVRRMGIQRQDGQVVAIYDLMIRNADGDELDMMSLDSALTAQEKAAIAAIFARDQSQFETATGLTEWIPPEEP